jgi:peptidoglycan hydrolase CwlO-like protein
MSSKKSELSVSERIRQHYQAEGGEWIIERGRKQEAALLREACLEIEQLNKKIRDFENKDWDIWQKNQELKDKIEEPLYAEIDDLQNTLAETRKQLAKREQLMTKFASEITWELKIAG